jgi:glucokinase
VTAARVLALDIGGTKLAAGVVSADGRVHSFVERPSLAGRGPDDMLERLFTLGREALEVAGVGADEIMAVGIGCGGPLDVVRGLVQGPPNLPGWDDVPIVGQAEKAYGVPARLENDAVAAALGEYQHGAGRGTQSMVYLTISTGVGGGVILDGRLMRGRSGNGGEIGHMIVVHDGRPCPCGSRGCLEAYCSGTSIAARARELLDGGAESVLSSLVNLTAADVSYAAADGDPFAAALWDDTTDILGTGVASLSNLFEADVIVLGGGVTRSGDRLLLPVRKRVAELAFTFAGEPSRVVLSELGEQVGVVGAATAAFEAFGRGSADA